MSVKKEMVKLKSIDTKPIEREFPISQANKLLQMQKPQWVLSDSNYTFNGIEIAKAGKKEEPKK